MAVLSGPRKRDLTREEWTQVATALKQASASLWEAAKKDGQTMPIAEMDKIVKVSRRVDRLKSDLEAEASHQHPDWGPPNAVFYGRLA